MIDYWPLNIKAKCTQRMMIPEKNAPLVNCGQGKAVANVPFLMAEKKNAQVRWVSDSVTQHLPLRCVRFVPNVQLTDYKKKHTNSH